MAENTEAAYIAGAAQVASTAANAWSAAQTNKKQRQWAEQMYAQQRADNQAQWHLQNEYNSPTSQMARLREAGLNPHLVYGKGADNVAAPMAAPSAPSWNPTAPRIELGGAIERYYDARIKDAQYDNLKVQNTVQTQEALLKAAQLVKLEEDTHKTRFERKMLEDNFQYFLEASKENVRKLKADTDMTLAENERRAMLNAANLKQAMVTVAHEKLKMANTVAEKNRINATIDQIKTSTQISNLDADLKRQGLNPTDPTYQRILGRALNEMLDGKSIYKQFKDWWNK